MVGSLFFHCSHFNSHSHGNHRFEPKGRATLYGPVKHTHEDAIEGAAQATIEYLCDHRNVRVHDVNREALNRKSKKLLAAEFWSDAFQEKATAVLQTYATTNNQFTAMQEQLRTLCHDFADWLNLEPVVLTEGAGQGNHMILKYNGPLGFPDRKDQFAIRLLQVLQGPKQAKDEPPFTPNCKNHQ